MSEEQVPQHRAIEGGPSQKDVRVPPEVPSERPDNAEIVDSEKVKKSEGFSPKDKITIGIASTSLLISATLFWINYIHVNHSLEVSVASIETYSTGDVKVTVAVFNNGNREAAVIKGRLLIWEDDFELADGWHKGGWTDRYSDLGFRSDMEPFSLKPGEVKIIPIIEKYNMGLLRAQIWGSRVGLGKKFRSIVYGLDMDALDGKGIRHHAEFPILYNRCSIRGADHLFTLGICLGDYAIPNKATPLFAIGVQRPYSHDAELSFTDVQWDIYDTEPQVGVRTNQ